jgi:hypothetical protein
MQESFDMITKHGVLDYFGRRKTQICILEWMGSVHKGRLPLTSWPGAPAPSLLD